MRPSILRGILPLLVLSLAGYLSSGARGQTQPTAADFVIPAVSLQADAAILRQAFEQIHPGLYRYNSKYQMDAHFEALQSTFAHDISLRDAYLALSVFAAQIQCGHTYLNFFNQPEPVVAALFRGQTRVPFYFRWVGQTTRGGQSVDHRMIVTRDFTPLHQLAPGSEVLSINGVPSAKILSRLLTVARADGSNTAKRVDYLQVTGDSNYEAFDVFFALFYPQTSPNLQLEIRPYGSKRITHLEVQALTYEQRIAPIEASETARKGGSAPLFTWSYLPNGAAYLQMPTWALFNSKWDWKTWLNTHLDEAADRNAPALIVDLRGNEGGLDAGDEILNRLRTTGKAPALQRLVRYRQTPAALAPYLDTWDPSFKDWGKSAVDLEQPWPTAPPVPYLRLVRDDNAPPAAINTTSEKPFRGKVYVLIDASNSSATFQFAQTIQRNRLGTLIGQTTGGSQRGINGGAFFFLRLPNSHLEVDLPIIGTFPESPEPDAGLTPDIPVIPTLSDLATGRDPYLARIQTLLPQKK